MIYTEVGIELDLDKLYEDLSESNQEILNIFLEGVLKQKDIEPKYDDGYSMEERDKMLEQLIEKAIE